MERNIHSISSQHFTARAVARYYRQQLSGTYVLHYTSSQSKLKCQILVASSESMWVDVCDNSQESGPENCFVQ